MKIGLAQINPIAGDMAGNRRLILGAYNRLVRQGAQMALFPELAVCGYPPRDLLFKSAFVPDNLDSLEMIARETGPVPLLAGFAEPNPSRKGLHFFNAAAWCQEGKVLRAARKILLPAYDVFDENRYFEPGDEVFVAGHRGLRVGVTLCEDIWTGPGIETSRRYHRDPVEDLAAANLDLLVNLSASPWHYGKTRFRREIVARAARQCGCPALYCNAAGGNDELIFDGHSMAADAQGRLMAELAKFKEDERIIDTERPGRAQAAGGEDGIADIHAALVLGLRDYARKSGFSKAVLGLSGGVDSAVTAALAADALGPENIMGVSLPSAISTPHSRDDAAALALNLGVEYHTLPVKEIVSAAEGALAELFEGRETDVTEENIQARARGMLLMAVSNKFGRLLLSTGNKSELAVGYCTLYGDMAGGLAVISDLPKTKVYELAEWFNREREVIPWNTIRKPPSAELRPGQTDADALPPYDVLDPILRMYVEEGLSRREIAQAGYDEAVVHEMARLVDLNEYKRKQAPPGLKITPLAFGAGRRIPIVQRYIS